MIISLLSIFALAFWPVNFPALNFPSWFSNYQPPQTVASPMPLPTPCVFPTQTTLPQTTPTPTPKPTLKPTAIPTPKPTSTTNINSSNVLTALNNWRAKNGVKALTLDQKLQDYAQSRANYLKSSGKLDNHAGFNNYIQNGGGFAKLGFNALAENQSWNYQGTADGLISQFYASSSGHNQNQLNPNYTHVGIGISGVFTNIVFGGSKR